MLENRNFIPQGQFFRRLEERKRWTPDFDEWRWFHSMTVFIYDDLKSGFEWNKHMEGAVKLCDGITILQKFEMKKMRSNRPIVFEKANGVPFSHHVEGELWQINIEHLNYLDYFYRNKEEYNRSVQNIHLVESDELGDEFLSKVHFYKGQPYVNAFMYLGNPPAWMNRGLVGKPASHHSPMDNREALAAKTTYDWHFLDEQENRTMSMWADGLSDDFEYGFGPANANGDWRGRHARVG